MTFTEAAKNKLFQIAKSSIEAGLEGKKYNPEPDPELEGKYGVFVTLKINDQLRGCIGYIQPIKPLYQAVSEMAYAAAFSDPRFPPVTKEEVKRLRFEITILSPLERIHDINQIEVGKHGLFIKKGVFQGLLLPQVAIEENWDRMTFLRHTCLKAGLPEDGWHDAEIYTFTGTILKE
ncbi:AMMECR1 domain-containing protein [candidate division WOR-3 bacterium]|uniref:AMMECR1 domain-containing protein n=1 Tax=candidate division WOR-3 bacterium TaxID=2052148 RepID=A0A660SL22_UNCW3|nr:MAG: AMMECR1 domain-containing protein [candidate division WOR-3 bacterium]